jgi:YegS/Rv2252/BmrU family lipid kinase
LSGPEKIAFDEPISERGFLGRSRILPPKKKPHFSNSQIKENYNTVRVHLIINPSSGRKKGLEVAREVEANLIESKIKIKTYITKEPNHAIQIVKDLDLVEGDVIASIGGDGTFCEVISGFMIRNDNAHEKFPLALIPAGTGNSQAHDMGIEDYQVAVGKIMNGNLKKMDIGKTKFILEGKEEIRYSHNLVGWGLGVDSNILAEKLRFLGPLRYDIGVLLSIIRGKVRKARCYIDGHLIDSSFILLLIQNTCTGGDRLSLAPYAQVDDGKMDIGIIYRISRSKVLALFNQLKAGGSHVWNPNVEFYRFSTLKIETDEPTAINIDGENIGTTPLEIEVLPSVLKIFI